MRGHWVVQEQNGLFGGLFTNRAAAVRYALFENGNHPEAVVAIAGALELDMHAGRGAFGQATLAAGVDLERRVA